VVFVEAMFIHNDKIVKVTFHISGTFGKVYCGTLLSEEDSEVADQEIFVKTITGKNILIVIPQTYEIRGRYTGVSRRLSGWSVKEM